MILRILRSPYLISALGLIVIFLIIHPSLPKYSLKPTEHITDAGGEEQYILTYDLDDDGKSEFIRYKKSQVHDAAVVVSYNTGTVLEQWNVKGGEFRKTAKFYGFGDYDSNGYGEVYFLVKLEDELYMYFLEPMRDRNVEMDSIKICDFRPGTEIGDVSYSFNRMTDLDGDGFKDVIVSVVAGFSIYPRGVVLVNIKDRSKVKYSISSNALFNTELFDVDGDGKPELFFNSSSKANMDVGLPPGDNDNYVSALILDPDEPNKYDDLFCVFSPHGRIRMIPFMAETDTLLLGLAYVEYCKNPIAYFWDKNGILMDSLVMEAEEYPDGWETGFIKKSFNNELVINSPKGYLFTIDKRRQFKKIGVLERGTRFVKSMDINEDGVKEYIGVLEENALVIYSDGFRTKAKIDIPRVDFEKRNFLVSKYYYENEPFLFVQNGSITKCYHFGKNWLRWGQYLILLSSILSIWVFIFMILRQERIMFERKQKAKDEISKLEFQAIANQINPHFSYNILNTIGYSVLNEDRNKAYKLLVKYSSLTRNLIEGGARSDRTLRQEIGFVESYLELQQSRYEDTFKFSIDIDPLVDQDMLVPRMIILTFVENAIKHGLSPKPDDKILRIRIYTRDSIVVIEVEDNGVGRKAASDNHVDSTRQGLGILNKIIDIHKKIKKKEISYEIFDLEEGQSGTRVEVRMEI